MGTGMAITAAGTAIAAIIMGGLSAAVTGDTIIDELRSNPSDRKAGRFPPSLKAAGANPAAFVREASVLALVVHPVARRQFRRALRPSHRALVVHAVARAELRRARAGVGP